MTEEPMTEEVLEIDTSAPEEWPTDPEEWPRDLVVQDIDGGGRAVFTRVLTNEGEDHD
jgi:hypothetical protein